MDTIVLPVSTRSAHARSVRTSGMIPAIYYGRGEKPLTLQIDYQTFRRAYQRSGESTVLDLDVDEGKKNFKVLVHQVQMDPVRDTFMHVDFLYVDMTKNVTTHVPLEFTGDSPAVIDLGGILTVNKHEVEVRCLPEKLPHSLSLDISVLTDFHTSLHVKDIVLPEGVEILDQHDLTLVTVTAPRVEEEEVAKPAEVPEGEGEEQKPEEGAESENA